MNRAGYPMAIKHRGRCTGFTCVSSTPSKIPYGGFSPVRLQVGSPATAFAQSGLICGRSRYLRRERNSRSRTCVQAALPSSDADTPTQRPLAPRRVMLSRRILAYYGLIRATPSRLSAYLLRLPSIWGASGSPLLSVPLSSRAISRTPADRSGACGCFFPDRTSFRHLRTGSASALPCLTSALAGRVSRLASSLTLRPDWLLARRRPGLLRSSFRPVVHTNRTSNITTRQQPITAAGLSPARSTALWAANGDTEGTEISRRHQGSPCIFVYSVSPW